MLGESFSVFYSPTELVGIPASPNTEPWARRIGPQLSVAPGLEWQQGALSIPVERGDVVVICGAPRTLSTLAMIAKAKMSGAKVIWWGHFWTSTSKAWRFWIRMQMLRACDGILFYTDREIEEYLTTSTTDKKAILRGINNGINTEPIEAVRAPFDPAQRENTILFIGRLTPKAQLSLALEALACIPSGQCPRLEVIGSGEEQEQLVQISRTLGIENHITWHGAIVDEARIAAIANRCRLFLYPGEVGLSLIHAMAYGLPAVVHSARWRQMPEFAAFEDGVTGRAFRYRDARSLADTLMAVTGEGVLLREYSAGALSRVDDTFNTRDMAKRFVAMVRLVGKTGDRGASVDAGPKEGPL